jgi:uncharacterized membrane protein HdeD (DUF308 family)
MVMHPLLAGLEEVRRNWFWFLALGIALIVLGVLALGAPWLVTVASVLLFGWLLLFAGVAEAVGAFWARRWSGFFLHLLGGVLNIVIGLLLVAHPTLAALALTLLLAAFFLVGGLFRVGAAAAVQFPGWPWAVLSGAVTALLGLLIWAEWPSSAVWVIGLFVGIELIFRGVGWVMFALAARELPRPPNLGPEPPPPGP